MKELCTDSQFPVHTRSDMYFKIQVRCGTAVHTCSIMLSGRNLEFNRTILGINRQFLIKIWYSRL
jgi:hypothetical protein